MGCGSCGISANRHSAWPLPLYTAVCCFFSVGTCGPRTGSRVDSRKDTMHHALRRGRQPGSTARNSQRGQRSVGKPHDDPSQKTRSRRDLGIPPETARPARRTEHHNVRGVSFHREGDRRQEGVSHVTWRSIPQKRRKEVRSGKSFDLRPAQRIGRIDLAQSLVFGHALPLRRASKHPWDAFGLRPFRTERRAKETPVNPRPSGFKVSVFSDDAEWFSFV